jgi:hypothetical protein
METHYQYFFNAAGNFLTLIGAICLAVLPLIVTFINHCLKKQYRLSWLITIPSIFYVVIFFSVAYAYSKMIHLLAQNRFEDFIIDYWLNYLQIFSSNPISLELVIWWCLFLTTIILVTLMFVIRSLGLKKEDLGPTKGEHDESN